MGWANKSTIRKVLLRHIGANYLGKHFESLVTAFESTAQSLSFSKINLKAIRKAGSASSGSTSKRIIASVPNFSNEAIAISYAAKRIIGAFGIRSVNRNTVCRDLFREMESLPVLGQFSIIRFDFARFFETIPTMLVYKKYIEKSSLVRQERNLILAFCSKVNYCYGGLAISNAFTELISRDFDKEVRRLFAAQGIIFYQRYVDDGIILLRDKIEREKAFSLLHSAVKKVFYPPDYVGGPNPPSKVWIHGEGEKFSVLTKSTLQDQDSFNYLGYEFVFNKPKKSFLFGIAKKKRDKIIENLAEKLAEANAISPLLVREVARNACRRVVFTTSPIALSIRLGLTMVWGQTIGNL